jgi:tetratricopeptide (TPR) repeat protein
MSSISHVVETPSRTAQIYDETGLSALTLEAWRWRERNREHAHTLAQQVLQNTDDTRLRAQALIVQAHLSWRKGQIAQALEQIQPALIVMREHKLLDWLARALNVRNCIGLELGEFAQSVAGLEEQLSVSQAANNLEMEACALHDLGVMHFERNPSRAEPFLQRSLELFVQADLREGHAYTLLNLAYVRETQGDVAQARLLLQKVLELARTNGFDYIETHALAQQGRLELTDGNLELARALLTLALGRTEQTGDRPLAEVMPSLVECYRRSGNLGEARQLLERHLESVQERGLLPPPSTSPRASDGCPRGTG